MTLFLQAPIDEERRYADMETWLKVHAVDWLNPETGETNAAGLVEDWARYSGQMSEVDAVLSDPCHPVWEAARSALIAAEFAAARAAIAALIESAI